MQQFFKVVFVICFMSNNLSSTALADCNNRILPSSPDSRFEKLDTNNRMAFYEIKDTKTQLIWQRCSVGQTWDGFICSGTATTHSWADALALASKGWRLPNIKELSSITEVACSAPSINSTIFPNTVSDNYWSSSTDYTNRFRASNIDFEYGTISYVQKQGSNYHTSYVRLVRGGGGNKIEVITKVEDLP